jgi:RNase P/RNase MRP subunit p30
MGQGGLNKHNRFFIEQTPIDVLVDPQSQKLLTRRDFIHHFNAGLNHVLMKQAAEKGIILLITLNDLKKSSVDEIKGLGRVQQLCSLAGKYGVGISVSSLLSRVSQIRTTSEHQKIMALFSASGKQKRDSGRLLTEKIRENAFKHSSSHITEGLEVMG